MAAKKGDPRADEKTQPARRAVRRAAPDVGAVKTTPARGAVARRAAPSSRAPVAKTALDELLDQVAVGRPLHVVGRDELDDGTGTAGQGFVVRNEADELCRLVLPPRGLFGALVRSRFELDDAFAWLRADGEPLGHLVVTLKRVDLLDEADRVLWTMETGPFARTTRLSGWVNRPNYPERFTVFDGGGERPLFSIGRTVGGPVDVTRDGELLGVVQGVMRDGPMMRYVDGFRVDAGPGVPAAHRMWMALAVAASTHLVAEYERRFHRRR